MSSIAAIRTNRWGEEEERLLSRLRPVFGDRIAVVFHNRAPGLTPPVDVIDIDAEWVLRQGLFLAPDWGWRCGDYFQYALRAARPGHDHYWLIEPDVHFTSPADSFFAPFDRVHSDVLGYQLGPFSADIRFTRGMPGVAHHRAIFALTRFSGRALDRLLPKRQAMAQATVSVRDYPNDEIFAFSSAAADPDLTLARIEDHAPDWFRDAQFAPDPDLLFDHVAATAPKGRVLHPVRSREAFKRALARRLTGNTGILVRMRQSLDLLDDADVEEIAEMAAGNIRSVLVGIRQQRAARARRQARQS